jgi:S1-C subfamily serine protease
MTARCSRLHILCSRRIKLWLSSRRAELISATVIGSSVSADVALLQLDHNPTTAVAAVLGDSNKVDVGMKSLSSERRTV